MKPSLVFVLNHAYGFYLIPSKRWHHLMMSAQIDQRLFSNKCIDRPNGKISKLHDWTHFQKEQLLLL